jgi:dihydroflavonol-4-reductase
VKILVTGASGFIGGAVVRRAIADGHAVRGLVRASSRTERIDDLPWQRAVGDIRDPRAVADAIDGCDAVIHLAAIVAWDRMSSPELSQVIEGGTAAVLDAARAAGARAGDPSRAPRVVVVSSVAAMAGTAEPRVLDESSELPPMPAALVYGAAKRRAEEASARAAAAGLPVIVARPTEVYGAGDRDLIASGTLVDFARSYPVLVCRGGTSVVHVDDIARALVRAAVVGHAGATYLLGGENLTVRELAALCLEILGRRAPIVCVPNAWLRAMTRVGQALRVPLPYNAPAVPYATRYWFVDASKAQRELGVSFRGARETLTDALAWLEAAGHI